jgi:hypothetical protein
VPAFFGKLEDSWQHTPTLSETKSAQPRFTLR